jgi:tetratricopeptide (TPR) repeat protein
MAARAVEQSGVDRIEEHYELLAHHYSRSPNVEKAVHYLERANLKAIKANAVADAEIHFATALQLYSKLPDTRENRRRRIVMLVQQYPVYLLQLKMTHYEELLSAHESVAKSVEDDGLLGRLYGCIGHCHWFMARPDEALGYVRKAAALCEQAGEMGGAAFAYTLIQVIFWAKGEFQQTVDCEEQALQAHASSPNLRIYMWVLTFSGWALGVLGQFDLALDKCRLAMAAGEAASDPHYEGYAHRLLGDVRLKQGDAEALRDAQRHFETALSLFEMCGAEPDIARTYSGLGQVMLREGKTDEAHSYLTRAQETFERLGMLDRVPVR